MALFTSRRAPTCPFCFRDFYRQAEALEEAKDVVIKCPCGHSFKTSALKEICFNNEGINTEDTI